jgi:hypothetical protein
MAITDKFPVHSRETGIVTYYARIDVAGGAGVATVVGSSGMTIARNAGPPINYTLSFDLQDTPDVRGGADVAVDLAAGAGARLLYWDVRHADDKPTGGLDDGNFALVRNADNTLTLSYEVDAAGGDINLPDGSSYAVFVFDTRLGDDFA